MSFKNPFLVISILFYPLLNVIGQNYEICHWLDDRSSATVLTFDDYSPAHWEIAIPKLEQEGLPGTFFVTINNIWHSGHYQIMNDAISNGIEIGFHTDTHPNLKLLNSQELQFELVDSKISFDSNLTTPSLTMAYPFGSFNNTVIEKTKEEHIAARTVFEPTGGNWEYEFVTQEDDYFKIPTKAVNTNLSLAAYKNEVISGMNTGGMVTFMYHSIYNDAGDGDTWFDTIHEKNFQDQLDYLHTVKNQTWVTTFSNAVRYHKEQHCATLATVENTSDQLTLTLKDTLTNNNIYNHPLTVKLYISVSERYTNITQNGNPVSFSLSSNEDFYLMNLTPDGGEIILTKDKSLATNSFVTDQTHIQVFPSPSSTSIKIETEVKIDNLEILDIQGRGMAGIFILKENVVNIEHLSNGHYFALVFSNDSTYCIPFVKN